MTAHSREGFEAAASGTWKKVKKWEEGEDEEGVREIKQLHAHFLHMRTHVCSTGTCSFSPSGLGGIKTLLLITKLNAYIVPY